MGGSSSYGLRLLVFGNVSRSEGFKRKSDIALIGVIKFLSRDGAVKSTLIRLITEIKYFYSEFISNFYASKKN